MNRKINHPFFEFYPRVSAQIKDELNVELSEEIITSILGYQLNSNNPIEDVMNDISIDEDKFYSILNNGINSYIDSISFTPDYVIDLAKDKVEKAKIKVKGKIWTIHKTDKDPFPSNPHAHEYSLGLKLNIYSGELYNKKREIVSKLNRKELKQLHDIIKTRNIDF